MKPKFITCNYTNLYGTRLNGRLNRDFIFMYSLRSIADCGDIIFNYTCPYNINLTKPYLQEQGITNVIDIDYDLSQSPYHQRIEAIKDKEPRYYEEVGWQNRCVEIMWGKFLWLEDACKLIEDNETIYWIDAGLSQGCITPRKFNPYHNNKNYYKEDGSDLTLEYAHRHDRIYNKDFMRKVDEYSGDKIMLICSSHAQHGDGFGFDTPRNELELWPIGGLFGGKKSVMLKFIARFKELANKILAHGHLVKEEQIMGLILNESPEWFKTFSFDTWYSDDWDVFHQLKRDNPKIVSFSDFFIDGIKCL